MPQQEAGKLGHEIVDKQRVQPTVEFVERTGERCTERRVVDDCLGHEGQRRATHGVGQQRRFQIEHVIAQFRVGAGAAIMHLVRV